MEKRGLGRGLGSLIPGAGWREERTTPIEIALDAISFNPYQPRKGYDDEKFQDLVRSVRVTPSVAQLEQFVALVRAAGPKAKVLVHCHQRAAKKSELGRDVFLHSPLPPV